MNEGTFLHLAVKLSNLKLIALCLEYNVNINARDDQGNTPLYYAACRCNSAITQYLLNKNAGVDLYNKKGETPLHALAKGKRVFHTRYNYRLVPHWVTIS